MPLSGLAGLGEFGVNLFYGILDFAAAKHVVGCFVGAVVNTAQKVRPFFTCPAHRALAPMRANSDQSRLGFGAGLGLRFGIVQPTKFFFDLALTPLHRPFFAP